MVTADTNRLESLPRELLEEITLKINRSFRDLIRSPRIPRRLDPYAARLEYNLAASVTVADGTKALEEYHSKWEKFTSEEQQMTVRIPVREFERDETAGAVYGLATKHEILFFTLPSNSRTIQSRKQTWLWLEDKPVTPCKSISWRIRPRRD